jgi:hypothetical protein
MVIQWSSNGHSMVIQWSSNGHPMVIQCCFSSGLVEECQKLMPCIIMVSNRVDVFFHLISAIDIEADACAFIVKIIVFSSFKSVVDCEI